MTQLHSTCHLQGSNWFTHELATAFLICGLSNLAVANFGVEEIALGVVHGQREMIRMLISSGKR